MPTKHLRFGNGFHVALANKRAQGATIVIAPGGSEGGPDNRHRGADQWLFVRLYSRKRDRTTGKRRNLGTFKTRAAAQKHERAVQFFKRGG